MSRTQKFGIKFPIQAKSGKSLLDLNKTVSDGVKSELVHLIFTPEGQKLRDPLFGTKLIQYIFDPNDMQTWDDIVIEVKEKVRSYIPNCDVSGIEVSSTEENKGVIVVVKYSVTEMDGERHSYELTQII